MDGYATGTTAWAPQATAPTDMPGGRSHLGAATSAAPDGRIYAIGGEDSAFKIVGTVEAYRPANTNWATVAPMPTARKDLAVATGSDGRIYAMGGRDVDGVLATVEAYTPATNTWTTV